MFSRRGTAAAICFILAALHSTSAVFIRHEEANNILKTRQKRANSFFEEIMMKASLERECMEEKCSYEEAREVFEDDKRTMGFWNVYTDADQCASNPCQNGGRCDDQYQSYVCQCAEGYEGRNCEQALNLTLKCLYDNGQCEQFCRDTTTIRECWCADGYTLSDDGVSCIPAVEYPCGKIPVLKNRTEKEQDGRIVGGVQCPKGECPWQALLNKGMKFRCGGVLVAEKWVLTAAHCLINTPANELVVVLGDHKISASEGTEQVRKVSRIIRHEGYIGKAKRHDHDLALLLLDAPVNYTDYVVPVCLADQQFAVRELTSIKYSTVSGWGRLLEEGATPDILRRIDLPRVRTRECIEESGINITENMFCAGFLDGTKDSCQGDSGGPHITKYKDTWYLTGIVSWGMGCARKGLYGVYTRLSRYTDWLAENMKA